MTEGGMRGRGEVPHKLGTTGERRMTEEEARMAALRNANACQQMADLCDELGTLAPGATPREFLRSLGALVAGIDLGSKGFVQLARGGANGLIGAGFRADYDDGTAGQARHFAGTAAAAGLVGEKPAELLAHHVVDPAESIDGHLSTAALEFARLLIGGELSLDRAGRWIEANICDPGFETTEGFTPFDVVNNEVSYENAVLRDRFSDIEWRVLCDLSEQVVVAAAVAEWTGDFDDLRDVIAGIRGFEAAANDSSALVRAVVASRYDTGFEWTVSSGSSDEQIEQTLRLVCEQLVFLGIRGISPDDIEAYARFLFHVANASVHGSRSGGILGIGGEPVSLPESRFLDRLEDTLEACLPGCDECFG